MLEQSFTQMRQDRLDAQIDRARANVQALTQHAIDTGAKMPPREELDAEMKLYHMGGRAAFFFCLWFSFIAPIVLILINWN